jgi:hypothetical protein
MLHNVTVWALAPLAYPGLLLLVAYCLGADAAAPVSNALLPIWATNVAFGAWLYWEGFKINVASSATRPAGWERYALVGLIPLFVLLECLAIAKALVGLVRSRDVEFVVIAKPL